MKKRTASRKVKATHAKQNDSYQGIEVGRCQEATNTRWIDKLLSSRFRSPPQKMQLSGLKKCDRAVEHKLCGRRMQVRKRYLT